MNTEHVKFTIVTLIGFLVFTVVYNFVKEPLLSLILTIAISMAIFTGLNVHIEYEGKDE